MCNCNERIEDKAALERVEDARATMLRDMGLRLTPIELADTAEAAGVKPIRVSMFDDASNVVSMEDWVAMQNVIALTREVIANEARAKMIQANTSGGSR